MAHVFTVEQARRLLPEVRAHAAELVAVRADLVDLQTALDRGVPSPLGALPEAKGLEARLSELLSWFGERGLDVKGVAPLLLDFPATLNGETILLCWLEGEPGLGWYHKPEHGFAGRRVIPEPPKTGPDVR
ncbi:MAG TPA: DUF2203 domain-containing protein [Streptosporangiaceae bacterium]|nr:DUF2203 domain-containing protein [Streptosporangiaceae bacterium]